MSRCPSREQLQQLLAEQLSEAEQQAVETHVQACAACQETLARLSEEGAELDAKRFAGSSPAPVAASDLDFVRQLQENPPPVESRPSLPPEGSPVTAITFPGPATEKGPLGQLDGFAIRRVLGAGRFGIVYEATDELNRLVSIKVLKPEFAASAKERARFEHEARTAAAVKHDHIVTLHQVGHTPSFPLPYLVMEYVEGETLSERLEREGLVEAKEAARIVQQLALALAAAHARGLVHRDIKPSNVLLEAASGRAKLTDFGLARLAEVAGVSTSHSGRIVGTPAYMSPEQIIAPGQIDGRSDVYSLGVVLYELLTGARPFRGAVQQLLQQVVNDEAQSPRQLNDAVPRDLETITLKCLAKQPGYRYQTANDLAEDLRRFGAGEPIAARPVGKFERTWRWCRRNPGLAGALGAAAFFLLAGTLVSSLFAVYALGEAKRADQEATTAKDKENLAREAKLWSDRRYYASEMKLASLEAETGQMGLVQQRLREHEPQGDGDPDLRGFEWYYLQGICHSDLRTLKGHTDLIQSVVFSPDGRHLASASSDRTVKLWDAATGQETLTLRGHTSYVIGVAFSPDGRRLASASVDGTVKVWDAATGQETFTLKGHMSTVAGVAFSPDGRRLASACGDGTVKVWDTATNLLTMGFDGIDYCVDGTVKVWDTATGQESLTLKGHTGVVRSVVFSPDGRRLASASWDRTVKVWDAATGQETLTLKGHMSAVAGVVFSPDGRRLASASEDRTVKVWDMATGQESLTLKGHASNVFGVAFSPDGHRLASASADPTVKVWDAATGQESLALKGHMSAVYGVAFSPDGRRLASASADRTVKVWDAATDQESLALKGHMSTVAGVAFSPDGRRLASASADGTVKVWDARTGQETLTLKGHTSSVHAVAYSPDGRRLASASADRTVKVWDTATGHEILTLKGHTSLVESVVFSPDGRRLASASGDGTVKVWDTATGQESLTLKGHTSSVYGVAFSPDGRRLASASADRTVKVWDTATGHEILTLKGHMSTVAGVAFSPDGRRLASASWDQTVKVWDAATGQDVITLKGHTSLVYGVVFSPDGRRLASASRDQTVKVWEAATGQDVITLKGHTSLVYGVVFSPDGRRLASASADRTVKVWDATDLTKERLIEREARGLVQFLLAKPLSADEAAAAIRRDPTITEGVRQQALAWVEPFWRSRGSNEAARSP